MVKVQNGGKAMFLSNVVWRLESSALTWHEKMAIDLPEQGSNGGKVQVG